MLERVGRLDQIAGVRRFIYDEGRASGVRAVEIRSGAGLRAVAVVDRALDVYELEYRGIPLVWHAPGGLAAPQYYQAVDADFARNFFGGLFTTCGLGNFGPGGRDSYGTFGMHGRINHLPAEEVAARTRRYGNDAAFEIDGTVREAQMFGEDLRLQRTICIAMGENAMDVHDVVTNDGGTRQPHMLLYHCNMGFPLLDDDARLFVSQRTMRPRDAQAAAGLASWDRGGAPDAAFAEQVFIHEPVACDDGYARTAMVNRALDGGRGVALSIRFDPTQLPALFTWRMLGVKTYVMGIEPANCPTIEGRETAAARGTLPFLEPGESRAYDLRFEVTGGSGIDRLLAQFSWPR